MGLDRFVYWKNKKDRPSLELVKQIFEDYLGNMAKVEVLDGPRLLAVLPGKPSFPFRRVKDLAYLAPASEQHEERWIEVFWDEKYIDVITRMTDEFTNAVAEGFATLAKRYWGGKSYQVT